MHRRDYLDGVSRVRKMDPAGVYPSMTFLKSYLNVFVSALLVASLSGCVEGEGEEAGEVGASPGGEESVVEMFSWWTEPGESEALHALIEEHEARRPNERIFNATSETGADVDALVQERFDLDDPPDIFQENVHDIAAFLEQRPGTLEPLNELFLHNGWDEVILPEVLELIETEGAIYSMPVGIHRENTLFYNTKLFNDHELSPPRSFEEFVEVCETLSGRGITPLATGYQGWILRNLFHNIAMSTMGGADYSDFVHGTGEPNDALIRQSIQNFRQVLELYIADKMRDTDYGWSDAAGAFFDGEAAMFLHGDWAAGYFQQRGWKAGAEYGASSPPGAEDVFMFVVDVFALPADAKNKAGALSFFETIGSLEGQIAFNSIKGSTPIRLDVDETLLTPVGSTTIDSLRNAEFVINTQSTTEVDQAVLSFAQSWDEEALLIVLTDYFFAPE